MIRKILFARRHGPFKCDRWHLGLFSFYTHDEDKRYSGLAIDPRGLLLWSLAGLLFGYVGAVSALFYTWNRNNSANLSYGEMLVLPVRWDSIQEQRAKASVEAGLQAMKGSHWAEAEMLIASGFQRAPSLLAGRSQLANFYLLTGRWPLGASLLSKGFSLRYPGRPYLADAFAVAQNADDLALCTDWCKQLLERFGSSMPPGDRSWLVVSEAQLLLSQDRFQEVSDLVASHSDQANTSLREAQVLALLKLGDYTQALNKLELWGRQHPEDALLVTCLQAQAFRQSGRLNEMAVRLDRACSMAPRESTVLLFSVTEFFEAGKKDSAKDALDRFLIRYRFAENHALIDGAMASFAKVKYAEGMDRLLRFAVQEKLPLRQMVLSKTMFHLTEAQIEPSRQLLQELDKLWNLENPRDRILRDFFNLLADAATDPRAETQLRLESFCRERRLEWDDFFRAAKVLDRFNREDTAMAVLDVALIRYPSSYHLGVLKKKVEAEVNAKAEAIAKAEAPVKAAAQAEADAKAAARAKVIAELEAKMKAKAEAKAKADAETAQRK